MSGIILSALAVFSLGSCASQSGAVDTRAKVYLVTQGPVLGESGSFWDNTEGIRADLRPWGGNASDANGVFYLAADSTNLYVRAEISDAAPQLQPKDGPIGMVWNSTSIEVYFGTKTSKHGDYEEGDNALQMWVIDDGDGVHKVMASRNGRVLNDRQYQAALVEWEAGKYCIEASFLLNLLQVYKPLKAGQKVRCEFRINHAKQGASRSVIVNWKTSTDDSSKNPSVWSDGIILRKIGEN